MANKVILSEQFKLKLMDILSGMPVAIGTPILYALQEMIPGWDVDPVIKIGLGALISYLLKKLAEPASVTTTYSSNSKATEIAKDIKSK